MIAIDGEIYAAQLIEVVNSSIPQISTQKPSDWVESNIVMGKPFPGPFRYSRTPYAREIIDCFAPDHPMKWLAVMKGAQIGISAGVIIPAILWMIKNDPSNCYFLVGSPNLVEKATEKLDIGINSASLRSYIKPQVLRRKAQKSGDTNYKKEYVGGYTHIGSANNHKDIRDVSLKYGHFDDFAAVKRSSKESGNTRKKLEQRFAAYADQHKIGYYSTPELEEGDNIKEAFLLGDQREYLTPCPCCGEFIEWKFSVTEGEITGGLVWEINPETKKLVPGSVKYKCQKCGDQYDDKDKHELLNKGYWNPTAEPERPGYYSYHISTLYAPLGMYDWEHIVYDYLEANPDDGPRKEDLWKQFVNEVLGETYAESAQELKATAIMKNVRSYGIGIIPEKQSIEDGNGQIVLVTLAADMNGTVAGINGAEVDDARLDWQAKAWAENGASYSIAHGSIGTFIPREGSKKFKEDRERWSYQHNVHNSVWPEFNRTIRQPFKSDTGKTFYVNMPCIDCGVYSDKAEAFLDWSIGQNPENPCVGVRGSKEEKYVLSNANLALFTPARYRNDVYFLQVGIYKDMVANYMQLKWQQGEGAQRPNFMNFPQPANGLYGFENFFEHYESEHRTRVTDKDGAVSFRWVKKNAAVQNHLWDTEIYNNAIKDIIVAKLGKDLGEKEFRWVDYVTYVLG